MCKLHRNFRTFPLKTWEWKRIAQKKTFRTKKLLTQLPYSPTSQPPQQFQNKSPSFYLFSFNPKEIPRRFCRKSRTLICRCKNNKTTMDSLMKTKDFSWNEGVYCLQCIHVGELLRTSCHAPTNVLEDQSVIKTLRTKKSSTGGGEKLSVSFELFE